MGIRSVALVGAFTPEQLGDRAGHALASGK